jgi:MoxR-like ATPase
LVRLARARALAEGRDFVIPDDIKDNAVAVLRHRLVLDPEWELGGGSVDQAVAHIVAGVETPRT